MYINNRQDWMQICMYIHKIVKESSKSVNSKKKYINNESKENELFASVKQLGCINTTMYRI